MSGGIGVRKPEWSLAVSAAMTFAGASGIVWGALTMAAMGGAETGATAAAIGVGIPLTVIGLAMGVNFWRGLVLMKAMRRGKGVIARWTVSPSQLEGFREAEKVLPPHTGRNAYKVPKKTPPEGIEVIFADDAVIVGDTYFGLSSTGMLSFHEVGIRPGNPMSFEFRLKLFFMRKSSGGGIITSQIPYVVRAPIATTATEEANRVLEHFRAILTGKVLAKPDFYPSRIRIGLIVAAVSAVVFALGMGLEMAGLSFGVTTLVMAVAGAVVGLGGLVLAAIAYTLGLKQRRKI